MRQLPPLPVREKYWIGIEREIQRIFNHFIYAPLLATIKNPTGEIHNAITSLMDAVSDGTVWYEDGHFSGTFNARITKDLRAIGAMYNQRSRTWSLKREYLPQEIRTAQAAADDRYRELRHGFIRTLNDVDIQSIDQFSDVKEKYREAINWMEGDFQKSLGAITIEVKLTDQQRDIIADEWGQNLDLYIKNWVEENVIKLRTQVSENVFAGRRSSDLVAMLQSNYGVSQRKAKFLARQETSLLMSKFRETRYGDMGIKQYRWSTSHDERVRHDHKDLNNEVYSWDAPPVTNRRTGKRNNPGEDFGCRCVAIAIVE